MTLAERFAALKSRNEAALILFLTAGDPDLDELPAILDTLQEAGADAIEIGIPFTDPIADGPTIQASSQRALDRGVTPDAVLKTLDRCNLRVPVVLMGYMNPVLRMGYDVFCQRAKAAGASAVIVCDLIPEEGADWIAAAGRNGIDTVFLAAPTSTPDRLDRVAQASQGFVYAVSRTGVTGKGSGEQDPETLVAELQKRTSVPVCVGFGVRAPEDVTRISRYADGAIVGSSLVDMLSESWQGGAGRAALADYVSALKAATRREERP